MAETKKTKKAETKKNGVMMHFKPSYAYQCVEFDYFVTDDNEEEVTKWLEKAVRMMIATAPEQPEKFPAKAAKPKPQKKFSGTDKASQKQLDLLKELGVPVRKGITRKEASDMIDMVLHPTPVTEEFEESDSVF